jgi:hypothetical protein
MGNHPVFREDTDEDIVSMSSTKQACNLIWDPSVTIMDFPAKRDLMMDLYHHRLEVILGKLLELTRAGVSVSFVIP